MIAAEELSLEEQVTYYRGAVHALKWAVDHAGDLGQVRTKLDELETELKAREQQLFEYQHSPC